MSKKIKVIRFAKGTTFRKPSVDSGAYWAAGEYWNYLSSCDERYDWGC